MTVAILMLLPLSVFEATTALPAAAVSRPARVSPRPGSCRSLGDGDLEALGRPVPLRTRPCGPICTPACRWSCRPARG